MRQQALPIHRSSTHLFLIFHEVEVSTGELRIQARRSRSTRRKLARLRTFQFFDHTGLFVSRSIIAEHGGRIEIASIEGRGTTASIMLPVGVGGP